MTRPENLHFCAPNINQGTGRHLSRITSRDSLIRMLVFATLAPICLLLCATSGLADSKSKRSRTNSETRSRRVADKNRTVGKTSVADRRRVANKGSISNRRGGDRRLAANRRGSADRKRSNVKLAGKQDNRRTRSRVNIRETAKVRESASKKTTVPNVKQTVLITPKQPNNREATRPTLVNDIVIISEVREVPTARGTGSGNNMPSIWPVAGAMRGGFGVRRNPFGGSSSEFHKGQDIHATYGAPVIATADGVVVLAGWLRGYGQVVYVDHGNGISTRYGHLSRIDATVGQVIKRGDQLGLVGSTGRSTGPHLHYEVRVDGQATNPTPYLPEIPVQPVKTSPATR